MSELFAKDLHIRAKYFYEAIKQLNLPPANIGKTSTLSEAVCL